MAFDMARLVLRTLTLAVTVLPGLLVQSLRAAIHKRTYRATPHPKNVLVIGGSFAGFQAATRLSQTLPSGFRVVLVERNSHLHYLFNFPRFSVVKGYEAMAFIPYSGLVRRAPRGAMEVVRDEVVEICGEAVRLESGRRMGYEFLVLAMGSSQPSPSKLRATGKTEGCAELRAWQEAVERAGRVAVVGGGPVGVEIATDVKSYYPEKEVTLVHSREQLLPRFGKRLHDHVMATLKGLPVEVLLGERPEIVDDEGKKELRFSNGRAKSFDLIIPCTGQRPNSHLMAAFASDTISKDTQEILTQPTLQVPAHPTIFAIGDVAQTGGPKMARAAFFQVETVVANILSLIGNKVAAARYKPMDVEGAIKLTLGKKAYATYMQDGPDNDILLGGSSGGDTLEVKKAWRMYNGSLDGYCEETT